MVKTTQGQGNGEKKAGIFIPEANIFISIEPGTNISQIQ